MDQNQSFQDFLASRGAEIPVLEFLVNLVLAAALGFVLRWIYIRYGHALSNRASFARNFVLLTMTTMLIITVVKSSLALSLGLVGALSIVRFRAAIKEPEELAYLFLAIAVGLGLGANQRAITLVAFVVIIGVTLLARRVRGQPDEQNLYLTVSSHNPNRVELSQIVDVLMKHCAVVSLKRFDHTAEMVEAAFHVQFDGFGKLQAAKADLQTLGEAVRISFLDSGGLESA